MKRTIIIAAIIILLIAALWAAPVVLAVLTGKWAYLLLLFASWILSQGLAILGMFLLLNEEDKKEEDQLWI